MCHTHAESPRGPRGCRGDWRSFASHFEHFHYPGPWFGYGHMGPFGVRRPLRFLAWKLQLDDGQISQLAAILNELKTERGQAEVDDRRALTLLADAAESEPFDQAKAAEAATMAQKKQGPAPVAKSGK